MESKELIHKSSSIKSLVITRQSDNQRRTIVAEVAEKTEKMKKETSYSTLEGRAIPDAGNSISKLKSVNTNIESGEEVEGFDGRTLYTRNLVPNFKGSKDKEDVMHEETEISAAKTLLEYASANTTRTKLGKGRRVVFADNTGINLAIRLQNDHLLDQ